MKPLFNQKIVIFRDTLSEVIPYQEYKLVDNQICLPILQQ